jgi:histidyl-tRNA synthetase
MKKADSSGARFAVIVGDDEAQVAELTLKSLRECEAVKLEQVRITLPAACQIIKSR